MISTNQCQDLLKVYLCQNLTKQCEYKFYSFNKIENVVVLRYKETGVKWNLNFMKLRMWDYYTN